MISAISPNGGSADERRILEKRFQNRIVVNPELTRKRVSYQGNRSVPGLRWMRYKEGFSRSLVDDVLNEYRPTSVLDPFAGLGTTPLVASSMGARALGIDIMPVGIMVGKAIAEVANGLSRAKLQSTGECLLEAVAANRPVHNRYAFPHVKITEAAFPEETESAIARARAFLDTLEDSRVKHVLNVACMTVLEDVSFTRKDGQYLRWDYRSGRSLRSRVDKGPIQPFYIALGSRLLQILQDVEPLEEEYGGVAPKLLIGSSLDLLQEIPSASVDLVLTSPPYANRYDYTRTYALELAWLGYDQYEFSDLRQRMLTATVENKSKRIWLRNRYSGNLGLLNKAFAMYRRQAAAHEVLSILNAHTAELGNRHVIRLIEGYFLEMAVIIAELGRITRPGGSVVMVNDNVQYHGEEVPVDLILSDFAEQSGFECDRIWMLPRGKGNSSQQMHRFGRREIRKCVYNWVRKDG